MTLLDKAAVSFGVVLTKTDKLSPAEIATMVAATEALALKHIAAFPEICVTSSLTGHGLDPLRGQIAALADH